MPLIHVMTPHSTTAVCDVRISDNCLDTIIATQDNDILVEGWIFYKRPVQVGTQTGAICPECVAEIVRIAGLEHGKKEDQEKGQS